MESKFQLLEKVEQKGRPVAPPSGEQEPAVSPEFIHFWEK
jgi:hypothetical protein